MTDTLKALDEIEAALTDIEAQQQYLRVGGAYVDDTSGLEAGLERAVEISTQALALLPTLRAALTPPAAVEDGWQPIETARDTLPDRRARLIYVAGTQCIYCVTWREGGYELPEGWGVFGGDWRAILQGATHWRPLPPPPETKP